MTSRGRLAWLLAIEIFLFATPLLFPNGLSPFIVFGMYGIAALLAGFAAIQWFRKWKADGFAVPGVAVHFIVELREGQAEQRRYLFDQVKADGASVELFLSASDVLTLCVTDIRGEKYSLECQIGRKGMPLAERVYLAAEIAVLKKATRLSLFLDGSVVQERELDFSIDLGDNEWGRIGTIGSDRGGKNNGKFRMGEFILRDTTLTRIEKRQLLKYFREKWKIGD